MDTFDGRRMARLRKARGLTQQQLAREVHRNRITISQIERDRLRPSAALAGAIAAALGVGVDALHAELTFGSEPTGGPGASPPAQEAELLEAFRRLSPDHRGYVVGYVRGLAESRSIAAAAAAGQLREAAERARGGDGDVPDGARDGRRSAHRPG